MTERQSKSRAVFELRLHIVFVTKYRRPCLSDAVQQEAKLAFADILAQWDCTLVEFGAEADHVHLIAEIHPALEISRLINNLKSASSKRLRNRFPEHFANFYWKPLLWHRAYYVGSVGAASLETVMRYVERQGTKARQDGAIQADDQSNIESA